MKVEDGEKIDHTNSKHKETRGSINIKQNGLQKKEYTGDKERLFIKKKGAVHEEDIS